MSTITPCPSCGKLISFVTGKPAYRVCDCGKVIRQDENGQLIQTSERAVNIFPEIIQPGTTGTFNGKKFEVNGRLRLRFEESVINYWDISFNDDNDYWLMEGYGMYGILKRNDQRTIPFDGILANYTIGITKVEDGGWIFEEVDKIAEMAFEGEVELGAFRKNANIYGMASSKGEKLVVMEWQNNQYEVYELLFTGFAELQLKQLREPAYSPHIFDCSYCKAPITVQLLPYTGSVVCAACNQQYVYKFPHGFAKDKRLKYQITPAIPIGAGGEIKGIHYKVLSYAEKTEMEDSDVLWREYTLYNPQEGFAFLSEYSGHWIYVREQLETPVLINRTGESFDVNGESYVLYNRYRARVAAAAGEFPYNIFDDTEAMIREFISPPEMWIREDNFKEGITWFYGQHLSQADVKNGFGLSAMPLKIGVGAIQPTGYMNKFKVFVATFIFVALLILIHGLIAGFKEDKVLLERNYVFSDSALSQSFVTDPFDLQKSSSNMELDIFAPVSNSWFELSATLVNTQTGKEYSLEKGIEFYQGTDGGESWSEGSRRDQAYFTAIPAGKYILQLQTSRPATPELSNFDLKVTYDVSNGRNIWWSVLLFLLCPLYCLLKDFFQETRRWNNSPLPPNEYHHYEY